MIKKVALVLADNRGLSTFPAVYQSAIELKKRNFHVTILTNSKCEEDYLKEYFDEYVIMLTDGNWIHEINLFSNYIITNNFDIVIAFEPRDAINISVAALRKRRTKFIYYNLEIFEKDKKVNMTLTNILAENDVKKILERIYTSRCNCMVIQDQIRRKVSKMHGIYKRNTYLIPNSYYCNNDFKILNHNEIKILYSGGLEKWSIGDLLFKAIELPKSIIVTFSGWSRDNYIDKIKNFIIKNKNINLNLNNLTLEQYVNLVKEHDIGLVWYSSNSDNVMNIGRSSGKYFMYLSCSKPVIVRDLPGMGEDVKKYNFGVVIKSISELEGAVEKIRSNYEFYRNEIKKNYLTYFTYDKISKKFFDDLYP